MGLFDVLVMSDSYFRVWWEVGKLLCVCCGCVVFCIEVYGENWSIRM